MEKHLQQGLQILILMTAGIGSSDNPALAGPNSPTRDLRDYVQKKLDETEGKFQSRTTEVQKTKVVLDNLAKSIEALEKTLEPLKDTGVDEIRTEAAKMKETLDKLKAIQKKAKTDYEQGLTNSNALKRELQQALEAYFDKADPKMISERYGVAFDGLDFSGTPEFMNRTRDVQQPREHYGLGAEHTWDDSYWFKASGIGWQSIRLKSISQHEQVTTRDIYDMAQHLLERDHPIPGLHAPVGRVGMTINSTHLKEHPEAYRHVFGNESFTPSVLNNSTRWYTDLQDNKVYRDMMDLYTRGEGTRSFTIDGNTVTYGLPHVSQPILCNSAGNSGWDARPDFTIVKHLYPNRLNIGVATIPSLPNINRRDDKAKVEIEDYSSGCAVDAIIQRPRWHEDGTPIKTQYMNPEYRRVIEENLWTLAGKPIPKSSKDLDDVTVYPPALVEAIKADSEALARSCVRNEGVDEDGKHYNLRGTSFASPTVAGVLLAARIKFPDASEAEVIDAFLSSCEPIYRRKPEDKDATDDVKYMVDKASNWRFSPKGAGYGEFMLRADATPEKPDSWYKLLDRLEQMRAERMQLTRNGKLESKISVGTGDDRRDVVLNGQPAPVTIELPTLKSTTSDTMEKHAKKWERAVFKAFEQVQFNHDLSFMLDEKAPIPSLIKQHKYKEALDRLKEDFVKPGFVSESDPYFKDAAKAVEDAGKHTEYSYAVTVPAGHDICCTFAGMRLKFKDTADKYVVLESPDGRMVPLTMSASFDGYEMGSTSAFMRQSALGKKHGGTWKIHTRHELDTTNSSLVLSGTERNEELGIIDVRETILSRIEQSEAKTRMNVPRENLTQVNDPHETIRQLMDPKEQAPRKGKSAVMPSTYEDQHAYLQDFLDESQLVKGGFIPKGTLYREGIGERPDRLERSQQDLKKPIIDAVKQLFNLFSMSIEQDDMAIPMQGHRKLLERSQTRRSLAGSWGDMALATQAGELPLMDSLALRRQSPADGRSFHENTHNEELPYWQRQHFKDMLKQGRQSERGRKIA